MRFGFSSMALCAAVILFCATAHAQWKSQQVTLVPGWNAVHLEVEPESSKIGAVLQDLPVESVWYWNGRFRSVQFLADPDELLVDDPNWLVWFPPSTPQAAANRLFSLRGGSRYLIKLGGTQQVTLTLRGVPATQQVDWLTDSFSLVGFKIDPFSPQTFGDFFADSDAHQSSDAFWRLNTQGVWEPVSRSNFMRPGEAFWARTDGASIFQGPLTVSALPGDSLDYGRLADTLAFTVTNNSSQPKTLSFTSIPSDPPPSASSPSIAGAVPLSLVRFVTNDPTRTKELVPLTSTPQTLIIDPGKSREVRVTIRRSELADIPAGTNSYYQSIVKVSDGEGALIEIPARALAPNQNDGDFVRGTLSEQGRTRGSSASPYSGLWVGTVTLDSVSVPANLAAPQRLEQSSGDFPFRILLHVDDNGDVRLVKQVTLMAKTENNATRIVLVTEDEQLDDFEGVFSRDGELVGQRISSINFPFFDEASQPGNTLPMLAGTEFEDGDDATTDTLIFNVAMDYDDPVNPFMHRFHPDHDNLDALFEPFDEDSVDVVGDSAPDLAYADTNNKESFSILREVEFKFSGRDPVDAANTSADWLSTRVGGLYTERIYGLYRTDFGRKNGSTPLPIITPIVVGGRFDLVQVSTVGVLNDGN